LDYPILAEICGIGKSFDYLSDTLVNYNSTISLPREICLLVILFTVYDISGVLENRHEELQRAKILGVLLGHGLTVTVFSLMPAET